MRAAAACSTREGNSGTLSGHWGMLAEPRLSTGALSGGAGARVHPPLGPRTAPLLAQQQALGSFQDATTTTYPGAT